MINVVNAVGTSDEKCPNGYGSWLDFWERKTNKMATYCRNCGKSTRNLCGGHVQKVEQHSDGKWYRVTGLYIIPICPECNNPANNTIFRVDERELVKAL